MRLLSWRIDDLSRNTKVSSDRRMSSPLRGLPVQRTIAQTAMETFDRRCDVETSGHSRLVSDIAHLVQLLQQEVTDGEAMLSELTENAVRVVPGAGHAGITVADRSGSVRTAASSASRYPAMIDKIQQIHR